MSRLLIKAPLQPAESQKLHLKHQYWLDMARDENPRSLHFVDFCLSSSNSIIDGTRYELGKQFPKMQWKCRANSAARHGKSANRNWNVFSTTRLGVRARVKLTDEDGAKWWSALVKQMNCSVLWSGERCSVPRDEDDKCRPINNFHLVHVAALKKSAPKGRGGGTRQKIHF